MVYFFRNCCFLSLLLGSCVLSFAAAAEDLQQGLSAIEVEDYLQAYEVFKELAQQGNPEAQYNLAILYKQGRGVMQDVKQAVGWFRKAADAGIADAQYYLGHLYDKGEGVEQNYAEAFNWYQKAAEQGNAAAQTNLGVLYASGDGVKQDVILAYVWFSLAAAQGVQAAVDNRNFVSQGMSETLLSNARALTSEYFQRYLTPFQSHAKEEESLSTNHPAVSDMHNTPGLDPHAGIQQHEHEH
jgi:TPR repeat protein